MISTQRKNTLAFFDFNLNFGGAPRGSIDLAGNLQGAGESVVVFDAYGANDRYLQYVMQKGLQLEVLVPGVKQTFIGGSGVVRVLRAVFQIPLLLRVAFSLRSRVLSNSVAVVWLNNEKSLAIAALALIGLGVKVALYHRGWAKAESFSFLFRLLIERRCNLLLAHSHSTVDNLKAIFQSKKILYVPNGIRPKAAMEKDDFKRKGDTFEILLPAARPVREKGHHVAIAAVGELKRRGISNVLLILPGEVATGVSDRYRSELHDLSEELGVAENILFPGWLDSLDDQIRRSDVVILPSHTEGFPRVVIEAMLLRTPVVATPVGGVPEAIVHEQTGFIMDVDDVCGLADILQRLIERPDLIGSVVDSAYDFAVKNFSVERQIADVREAFHELIEDRG